LLALAREAEARQKRDLKALLVVIHGKPKDVHRDLTRAEQAALSRPADGKQEPAGVRLGDLFKAFGKPKVQIVPREEIHGRRDQRRGD
jgi:hypothetical protein